MIDSWVEDRFDNHVLTFPGGPSWRIGQRITEKEFEDGCDRDDGITVMEAVYHCQQIKGPEVGKEAILKIRMQYVSKLFSVSLLRQTTNMKRETRIPPLRNARYTYEDRCGFAIRGLSKVTQRELTALRWLNDHACYSTPKLYSWINATQSLEDMPVPGGYIFFLVMEKCPGGTSGGLLG